ncbi:monothiol glutaredoxin-S15, mitochondrial isoform X3 [Arachis ipaensis]|uniref:monothiol glutaredoxin-S15, mitochondrial isoform X3 n=1 Tax=Arachis ipaensis TaxID=130454 RepID=UPI0007AEEB6C|nr:monothiol glutaredoxin-S15, mitochondrial isoform X3 [Arachis ipaensis]XP_025611100.1 monothiol glutaredoxin-S15, mitochondrial isoform X2 [Arachis hypogaea]XP_025669427.1 monothiol glutaredoxin-S15, mitochondrial isoform X2 [Arachis hypogaea]
MAASLSSILFKGLASRSRSPSLATPCFQLSNYGMRYFTTVSNDPDTHDDFKPANKLENSGISLADVVEKDVKENPVMLYMKDVPISARNILEDPELKSAVKAFSHWPTFPQVFIKGEFIGGSDIILNMHQNGELKEKLKDITSKK